ncbi:MAG: hypothetical protein ACTHNW_22010 [Mucilaginibacter sp.]
MKPFTFLGILCLSLFSCKNKTEELKQKIIPIITTDLITKYSVKVDSIKILKIDTISDSLYNKLRTNNLYNDMQKYLDKENYYIDREKDLYNQAKDAYNAAHMELYTPDESQFRKEQMQTYNERADDAREYEGIVKNYGDTLNAIMKEINSLEKIAKTSKLNTHNTLGYFVRFNLLGANKDNTQLKVDTMGYCISPTFRIMKMDKLKL